MVFNIHNKIKCYTSIFKNNPTYFKSLLNKKLLSIGSMFFVVILSPFTIHFVVLIRLLKPFYIIRFGHLESEGIGHFSQSVEIYLAEVECGIHSTHRVLDMWYLNKIVCNKVLEKKWSEKLIIVPRMFKFVHMLNKIFPGSHVHEIPYRYISDQNTPWQVIDVNEVLHKTKPNIIFNDEEKNQCVKILIDAGFDVKRKFVCLSVRDGGFHNDAIISGHRNSSVNDYVDSIQYLNQLGYQVVRIGAEPSEKLTIHGPLIFDYSFSGIRSEILDLFLISECQFLVGTGSGIDVVTTLFRKPQVYLNIVEIGFLSWYSYNSIIILKKYQMINGEILSLSNIYKNHYDKFTLAYEFDESGITLIKNTNEEIEAALFEMHSRINDTWEVKPHDDELQELVKSYWPNEPQRGNITAKIGADFLRSNPQLLKVA